MMYRTGALASGTQGAVSGMRPVSLPQAAGRSIYPVPDMPARPVNAAEAAQAERFELLLQVELAHLQGMVKSMMPQWNRAGDGERRPPEAVKMLSDRIEEVGRLLNALWDRFPHS
jgi:hypothetical protein